MQALDVVHTAIESERARLDGHAVTPNTSKAEICKLLASCIALAERIDPGLMKGPYILGAQRREIAQAASALLRCVDDGTSAYAELRDRTARLMTPDRKRRDSSRWTS